ncbi:MAG: right-handed parallel beta-helix repeat-containing protein [Deltaproteobacteria bacterium]|nr:right-handed parallel beta-helix repeat-containing protein [Deltaproteobacteria bacterium]
MACGTSTRLVGEPVDGAADADATFDTDVPGEAEDGGVDGGDTADEGGSDSPDGAADDAAMDGEGGADEPDAADVAVEDVGAEDAADSEAGGPCPVWAVPSGVDPLEDGTDEHPFIGLRRALDSRGACDRIILRDGTEADPFDPRFDLSSPAGETLTIEGEPAGALAELDAAGGQGLVAVGEGALVLRHLAIRNGLATYGGCLDADVEELLVEDTQWSGCVAEGHVDPAEVPSGGAIRAVADVITVRRSVFSANTAGHGASLWLGGPRDTAIVSIEDNRFEGNAANWGGGIFAEVTSLHSSVTGNRFSGNEAEQGGAAVAWMWGTFGKFEGNRVADNFSANGAVVTVRGASETRILHNIFVGNRTNAGHEALQVVPAYGTIRNNVFARNSCEWSPTVGGCGGAVLVYAGRPDFSNNTFVDNSSEEGPADLAIGAVFGTVRNNLFLRGEGTMSVARERDDEETMIAPAYNNSWNRPLPAFDARLSLGDGNLLFDPVLVDPASDDYRLSPGSPCIDAGDPDPALLDADGSRNDIGAFGGPDGAWTPLGP